MPKGSKDSESEEDAGPELLYRPNVAAILEREDRKIFVAERVDRPGAWQFPQGGVDEGESPVQALRREVREEIGLRRRHFEIVESRTGYRYLFPNGHLKWKIYRGQEQTYFRCQFVGKDSDINLATEHPEFVAHRWIKPKEFDIGWLPKFKRDVYRKVLADFFGV